LIVRASCLHSEQGQEWVLFVNCLDERLIAVAVRIRMKLMGRKHRPYYRIVAIDGRAARDGRPIEELGTYDPMIRDTDARVTLVASRIKYWMSVGAKPSEHVAAFLRKYLAKFEKVEAEAAAAAAAAPAQPATVS
jgi:small subunit ribosomal protein S16